MTITCPKCHKEISIPDDKPSAVKCPHCHAINEDWNSVDDD